MRSNASSVCDVSVRLSNRYGIICTSNSFAFTVVIFLLYVWQRMLTDRCEYYLPGPQGRELNGCRYQRNPISINVVPVTRMYENCERRWSNVTNVISGITMYVFMSRPEVRRTLILFVLRCAHRQRYNLLPSNLQLIVIIMQLISLTSYHHLWLTYVPLIMYFSYPFIIYVSSWLCIL